MTTPIPRDGETIYADGERVGSIHLSQRSHRWYFKHGPTLSPARYYTSGDAEKALREMAK